MSFSYASKVRSPFEGELVEVCKIPQGINHDLSTCVFFSVLMGSKLREAKSEASGPFIVPFSFFLMDIYQEISVFIVYSTISISTDLVGDFDLLEALLKMALWFQSDRMASFLVKLFRQSLEEDLYYWDFSPFSLSYGTIDLREYFISWLIMDMNTLENRYVCTRVGKTREEPKTQIIQNLSSWLVVYTEKILGSQPIMMNGHFFTPFEENIVHIFRVWVFGNVITISFILRWKNDYFVGDVGTYIFGEWRMELPVFTVGVGHGDFMVEADRTSFLDLQRSEEKHLPSVYILDDILIHLCLAGMDTDELIIYRLLSNWRNSKFWEDEVDDIISNLE